MAGLALFFGYELLRVAGRLGCCPRRGAPLGFGSRRTRRRSFLRARRSWRMQLVVAVFEGSGDGPLDAQAEPGQRTADVADIDSK